MIIYCHWHLCFGMTIKDFWREDPSLLWAYRKSYMDKIKVQTEMSNQTAWLTGAYVFEAVSTALYNGFRKNGQPAKTYREEPFDLKTDKTSEEIRLEEIRKDEELMKKRSHEIQELLKQKEKQEGE